MLPLSCGKTLFENSPTLGASLEARAIRTSYIEKPDTTSAIPGSVSDRFREAFSPEVDSLFLDLQKRKEFSGTVLIARRGKIIHTGAYGYADLKAKEELTTESVFQLASVSKTFTATAILLLQQDGVLDIDDKIRYYIPDFPYENMTIRHLLNHRSGLSRYMGLMHASWDKRVHMNYKDVLDYYIKNKPPLFFQPDKKFEYCNTNYVFLAAMVEYLSKKTFADFLDERIFKPVGMESTWLCNYQERETRPNRTFSYQRTLRGYYKVEGDYLDGVFGDKGVYSTVMDLYRFDRALAEGKLLNQKHLTESCLPGSPEEKDQNYGLGWRMKPFYPDLVYHFGWWHGYRTCFIRDLQAETTVIILCNRDNRQKPINFWYVYQFVNGWIGHYA
ncbi:MAG: serine hydrolase domain-containing protein [Bacteroidia bacterium]|nr:serine hydrolase domain-containing protein [Bacteroidia bacterium]